MGKISCVDIHKHFYRYWNPHQHLVVDEAMIGFKGRFQGRQHVRGKPHATGRSLESF
jgi:hypothetical protein